MALLDDIMRFLTIGGYGSGYGNGNGSGDGYGSGYGGGNGNGNGSGNGNGYGSGYGSGDGDGSGYGNGYGSGYGYGSGDGDGSGYGNGYGSGYGSGYGNGNGSGDGDGSGYGSGDGDGSGYGNGYGDGDGSMVSVNGKRVHYIDDVPTIIFAVHGGFATGAMVQQDWSLKRCHIARVGDVFAHGYTLHDAVRDATAKALQNEPLGLRIERFKAAFPDFTQLVPCRELFVWHNALTGSCEAGRRQFAAEHGIDIEHGSMTVNEFIRLTQDAYCGENIKKLKS